MKEKDLKTIWEVPIYLPYLQPTLTEEMIEDAENKVRFRFPKEYLDLLRTQNGGYIRFTIEGTPHSQIAGIGPFFPSITDFEWLNDYKEELSYEIDGLLPFDGDGHWNICLDYRRNKIEPEITYINTESDYEKHIAKNFKEYLNLLVIDTTGEYVLETNHTIEETIKEISSFAKIEFEEPDYFAHGYPIYRSKYYGSWVWVSPNKVPKGFIRKGDNRYDELKSQMEISSSRYPEIPESNLFISVSEDNERQKLFAELAEKGIVIRELKDLL